MWWGIPWPKCWYSRCSIGFISAEVSILLRGGTFMWLSFKYASKSWSRRWWIMKRQLSVWKEWLPWTRSAHLQSPARLRISKASFSRFFRRSSITIPSLYKNSSSKILTITKSTEINSKFCLVIKNDTYSHWWQIRRRALMKWSSTKSF